MTAEYLLKLSALGGLGGVTHQKTAFGGPRNLIHKEDDLGMTLTVHSGGPGGGDTQSDTAGFT